MSEKRKKIKFMENIKVNGFDPNHYVEEAELEAKVNGKDYIFVLDKMEYNYSLDRNDNRIFNLTSYECLRIEVAGDEEKEIVFTPEEKELVERALVERVDWCEWLSCQEIDPDFYRD